MSMQIKKCLNYNLDYRSTLMALIRVSIIKVDKIGNITCLKY